MKKLFAILFIVIGLQGFSQSLPYLNASRGNQNECVVDKDTNIYLFHFNQIEKYNKHLQSIWVKRYDSLIISNLLLSKTNALFFIANKNCIGKMDTAGNIVWCKKTSLTFVNMMLDHSNSLMIAHTSGLFKMDTIGNVIYCKKFKNQFNNLSGIGLVVNDSVGEYDFIGSLFTGASVNIFKIRYSELLDSITSIKGKANYLNYPQGGLIDTYVSQFFSNTTYVYSRQSINGWGGFSVGTFEKYVGDFVVYSIPYNGCDCPQNLFNNITEDKYGNVYFSQSRQGDGLAPVYYGGYYNDIYKIDSLGNHVITSRLINDIWTNNPPVNIVPKEKGTFHFLYNNHFVLDYVGRGYGLNNPAIKSIDSTISTSCSSATTYTFIKGQGAFSTITSPVISKSSDVSYSITTQTVNITVVSNFVPDTNYCLTIGLNELKDNNANIFIYPNPANDVLNIEFSKTPELTEQSITIEITNTLGQLVLQEKMLNPHSSLSIQQLQSGVYYLEFKTTNSIIRKKFIKQ